MLGNKFHKKHALITVFIVSAFFHEVSENFLIFYTSLAAKYIILFLCFSVFGIHTSADVQNMGILCNDFTSKNATFRYFYNNVVYFTWS